MFPMEFYVNVIKGQGQSADVVYSTSFDPMLDCYQTCYSDCL